MCWDWCPEMSTPASAMTFTAFGPNSLALGGRAFDAVVLHTFFSDETTARCVGAVKKAAEQAAAAEACSAIG